MQTVTYPNGALRYYAYNQNQLTALFYEDTTNKLLGFWAYDYDTAGRIQSIRGTLVKAVVPTAMTATYDDANQLATLNGASLTSDSNGSQLTDSGLSFSYNVRGQMVGATAGSTTASYQTNPFGLRDTKTVNGVTTHFLYDLAGHLIAEVDASNKVQREYVWMGNMPVMLRVYDASGKATEYNIWADHLNTPRVVTDTSNNIVWKWDSDLYGNGAPSGSLIFNLRFPGQYYDAETGLHYNGARYYNPKTARYIQYDPLGLNVGWNTYAYVAGNPISAIDPWGLVWEYSQGSGVMTHVDDSTGAREVVGVGYAGQNEGLNNPENQSVPGIDHTTNGGPLPQGEYNIGPGHKNAVTGPNTMDLSPTDNPMNYQFGRSLFRIHGDNSAHNNSASEGCIVLGSKARHEINSSSDRRLVVVP